MSVIYFDQSGFSASPPVQWGWSPTGKPHRVFPLSHCSRSVLGALDFGANLLTLHTSKTTIKRHDVVQFLDQITRESTPSLTTVVVLDNARIHHNIDQEILDRWLLEHRMVLFYLPPYSPELNLIEIVWKHAKYHLRRLPVELGEFMAYAHTLSIECQECTREYRPATANPDGGHWIAYGLPCVRSMMNDASSFICISEKLVRKPAIPGSFRIRWVKMFA
ncbi:transposase [Paraburkholderia sediminicola]|uniref:transposase n=1 Tax=Paraburkholderia sediminicola TaxID=458836 RepID=UPI0038BC6F02